ncbi:MAG TPA: hypothetical protein VHB70_13395, partial [Parafilimonas sp.]|nr:hypothetical protein [Parafilimonas sp.]
PNRTYIISKTFAKKLNSFYEFKIESFRSEIHVKKDVWQKFYTGYLKDSILDDSSKIYSFLLGAYVRYGLATDTIDEIKVANSLTKSTTCLKLLKHIGCDEVSIKYTQSIPTQVIVYFKPTKKLEEMIEDFKPLMKDLNDSRNSFYQKFLEDSSDNKR